MNEFEELLREQFRFTDDQVYMVSMLETILGPASSAKVEALVRALLDKKNNILPAFICELSRAEAFTYCRSLGFAGVSELLAKAAQIVKSKQEKTQ